jgi:hypothetical protein
MPDSLHGRLQKFAGPEISQPKSWEALSTFMIPPPPPPPLLVSKFSLILYSFIPDVHLLQLYAALWILPS